MIKEGIFKAEELATYICGRYFEKYSDKITPIKLQKSLYFLFAYWGAFIRKSKENLEFVEEDMNFQEKLFDEEFQAWVYGPVIPEIFRKFKNNSLELDVNSHEIFDNKSTILKDTINSLLDELFEISDFKLVTISHEDNCWRNHFHMNSQTHDEIIPSEEIIREYAQRKSL